MYTLNTGLSISNTITFPHLPSKWEKSYEIQKELYISDNSRIYIIKDKKNYTDKVLKIVISNPMIKQTLKSLSQIKDTHLLLPETYCLNNNLYFIIYPFKDTLLNMICTNGITGDDIKKISENISSALETLHKHHILHLDINPGNIFCNNDGSFCLGDYSSAIIYPVKAKLSNLKLTPGYISPELADGKNPTIHSDYFMMLQTIFVLYNNGNNEFHSFNIDCSLSLSDNILLLINNLNISKDYILHITDKTHPLFYLKTTILYPENTLKNRITKNKTLFSKKIIYGFFIAVSALLMVKCLYGYMMSKRNSPAHCNDLNLSVITSPPESSVPALNSHQYIPISKPIQTPAPAAKSSNMPDIKEIDISGKEHLLIPKKYLKSEYTYSVTSIYACSCKLQSLQSISKFTNLQELYLTDNCISNINMLSDIKKLNTLIISYNNLHDISGLSLCKNLSVLDLSGNTNLANIKSLAKIKPLKILNLTNTNVTSSEINYLKKQLRKCDIVF